ncbi:MAG: hypothetical protein ACR2OT_01865 [Parvibaculales bacterium]
MPQINQNKNVQDLDDVSALLERLSDLDNRFERMITLIENLLSIQQQLTNFLDKGTRQETGNSALTGPPSQEQLGQNLSRYVLGQIERL